MVKIIKLRGHHLNQFVFYVREFFISQKMGVKDPDETFIQIDGDGGYSRESTIAALKVYKTILKKETKVHLTKTLDDICQACNIKVKRCSSNYWDIKTAKKYNLTIGKTYSSNYILRKLGIFL